LKTAVRPDAAVPQEEYADKERPSVQD